jgi:hypothetical protein
LAGLQEKEHPNAPLGTVKGKRTTAKQQRLFGIVRGMEKGETPRSYSPQAAKIAGSMSNKETHKVASKPKGGYRKSPSESLSDFDAEQAVMEMIYTEESRSKK